MRQGPFSYVAQSVALVLVGLVLLIFVLLRTFRTIFCGGFLICNGSLLPPFGDANALYEWIQHFSLLLLIGFAAVVFILIVMVYNRQDRDMMNALRITSIFFAAQGLGAAASMFLGYGYEPFHMLAGALTLGAVTVLMTRVLFTDNDEYRHATYLASLFLISILSIIPYFWLFTS